MLGLKDPTDNSSTCEYEPKSVFLKQNKVKKDPLPKETRALEILKCREPNNLAMIQDKNPRIEDSKITNDNESTFDVYNPTEQTEGNTKSFSIGSWINDLFNVPSKRQQSTREDDVKPIRAERLIDENSQYFKTISALKEEFKKKLRSETSIYVSNGDKPLEFDFCSNDKKAKKRTKSLPPLRSSGGHVDNNTDDIVLLEEEVKPDILTSEKTIPICPKHDDENILQSSKLKAGLDVNCNGLVKEKKKSKRKYRSDIEGLEEYTIPTLSELSKGLLLNINDTDKCTQLYKNTALSVQESQHYGPKKNKSYQNSARCYTTNTNLTESVGDMTFRSSVKNYSNYKRSKILQPFPNVDLRMTKSFQEQSRKEASRESRKKAFRKQSVKLFSEFSRDSSTYANDMSFTKPRAQKSVTAAESGKFDPRPSSDDLVKYLMKKVKSHKHLQPKKKVTVPAVVPTNVKSRIMQSATSSLVMNVLAKKENETLLPTKAGSRICIENGVFKGEIVSKPLFKAKDWSSKFKDNNVVKFDVKRKTSHNRFNKNSYLSGDLETKETPSDKSHVKNSGRPFEDIIGSVVKDRSEKFNRRLEVQKMLFKLDSRSLPFSSNTNKYGVKRSKSSKCPSLAKNSVAKESTNGRFQEQHQLFKSSIQPMTGFNLETNEKFEGEGVPYEVGKEFEKNVQQCASESAPETKTSETKEDEIDEQFLAGKGENEENSEEADENLEEKSEPICIDSDKSEKKTPKEKLIRTKSSQYIKDDSSSLLGSMTEYNTSESSSQKDNSKDSKAFEPPICPTEVRHGKTDPCLLNRRYSTNILNENKQRYKAFPLNNQFNKPATFVTEMREKEIEVEKKDVKEKKKEETSKCGFENGKKSGPGCEKFKSS